MVIVFGMFFRVKNQDENSQNFCQVSFAISKHCSLANVFQITTLVSNMKSNRSSNRSSRCKLDIGKHIVS